MWSNHNRCHMTTVDGRIKKFLVIHPDVIAPKNVAKPFMQSSDLMVTCPADGIDSARLRRFPQLDLLFKSLNHPCV